MGYSGGNKKNPTYYDLGDHSETVQIDFNPDQVSYEKLLNIFWSAHDPTGRAWSRQYRTSLFFHNEEQKRLAIETRDRLIAKIKGKIFTEILPASDFYLAEDYHQKYYLRQSAILLGEYLSIYPALQDFVNSTATARVNGYLAGYGTLPSLKAELESLGLSAQGKKRLLEIVSSSSR